MAIDEHRCCQDMQLEPIGDCGSVTGFDLTLERCRRCGAYVMDFYWGGSNTPNVVPPSVVSPYEIAREELTGLLQDLDRHEVAGD